MTTVSSFPAILIPDTESQPAPRCDARPYVLATSEEIIDEARNGRMFILVDDENRENEGDLIIPAQMATPEVVNFMAKHGRGLICLAMSRSRVEELKLPPMSKQNGTRQDTAFTVSIEARVGVTTGISAADRARTIAVAIDSSRGREHLVTPGHVFPLVARDGGVLVRAGHTEAAVDVARLAGLSPYGVICEIMNDDGTMARMPDLVPFAQRHSLKIGTIRDLIRFRSHHDVTIEYKRSYAFCSDFGGDWEAKLYVSNIDGAEHLALVKGTLNSSAPALVRMHSMSLLEDVMGQSGGRGSLLRASMQAIGDAGSGAVVMIRQDQSATFSELMSLGSALPPQPVSPAMRNYGVGAQILVHLGLQNIILLTDSTKHVLVGLEGYGLRIMEERAVGTQQTCVAHPIR